MLRSGFIGSWSIRVATILFGALLIDAFVAQGAYADWIHLKNGQKIQGKVLEKKNKWYVIRTEVPEGRIKIRVDRVKRVENEDKDDYTLDQALAKRGQGKYREALEDIRHVLQNNPDSSRARRVLRKTYRKAARDTFRRKQLSRSRSFVKEGLKTFPEEDELKKLQTKIKNYYQSVRELQEKAKTALQNDNVERAIHLYNRVRKRLPETLKTIAPRLAEAHAQLGIRQFKKENYETAQKHFRKAVSFAPSSMPDVKPYWINGILKKANRMLEKRKFSEATEYLSDQIDTFPEVKRLKFFLGTGFQYQGNINRAVRIYSNILNRPEPSDTHNVEDLRRKAAKASNLKLRSRDRKTRDRVLSGGWRKKTTEHFTILHRNKNIAAKAASVLENSYNRIQAFFKNISFHRNRTRKVYIYPSEQKFRQNSNMPNWSSGVTKTKNTSGGLQSFRVLTYQQAPRLFKVVLPHEVGHVMFGSAMARHKTPLWLEEGIAVWFEPQYQKTHYQIQVRSARSGNRLPSLKKLLNRDQYPTSERKKDLFYAQSYVLVKFLLQKKGGATLIQLGKTIDRKGHAEALKDLYGYASIEDLERDWETFVDTF